MNAAFFMPTDKPYDHFPDHSSLSNKELVHIVLDTFKKKGLTVYIRNYSFLGFHCYKFVVPGFSESRGLRIPQKMQQYAFGELASLALRNMRKADDLAMQDVLFHKSLIKGVHSREYYYPFLAGLPLAHGDHSTSAAVHYSYAAWRLGNHKEALNHLGTAIAYCADEMKKDYLECIRQYLRYSNDGMTREQIFPILSRFFHREHIRRLEDSLAKHGDPFSDLLMACQLPHCASCPHREVCYYEESKRIIHNTGLRYKQFIQGQSPEHFQI